MNGWIKLHRKFIEWEWFDKPEMVVFFIYILSKANFENKKWQGVDIPVGSFITSVSHLASGTFLTPRQIRTCLERLKNTGEISVKTTNKFTMLTINEYESYQGEGQDSDKQTTNKRQTNDKQTTTTKELKEIEEYKKESFERFWNLYDKKVGDKSKLLKKWNKLTDDEIAEIFRTLPFYKQSKPDKQFRRNPETYLNNKGWNDEIVGMPQKETSALEQVKQMLANGESKKQ